jgi:hypothetical protein
VRLLRFWSNSPAAWFRTADAQFALRRVTDPLEKYYLVLDALSEANMVRHIVEEEPDDGGDEQAEARQQRAVFCLFFPLQLPREVSILLSQEPVADMHGLAAKADALMTLHVPQQHEVAAVAPSDAEDSTVAAAARSSGKKTGQRKKKFQHRRQRSQTSDEKRAPLCWLHIRFGDKARRFEQPCVWPAAEN